jgi:hypothetical protein
VKTVTIRQALQQVADYPNPVDDEVVNAPVHELVCRALFDIANRPDASVRGSMARANKARKMILDRMVGKRRAGTTPAVRTKVEIDFVDLTGGELTHEDRDVDRRDPADAAAGADPVAVHPRDLPGRD